MKYDEFSKKIDEITEKIGDDASNLILDDIAVLLNDNKSMNEIIIQKDEKITNLNKRNENLQTVNGNLLQQVAMEKDTDEKFDEQKEENKKEISYRDIFDEFGNFKQ